MPTLYPQKKRNIHMLLPSLARIVAIILGSSWSLQALQLERAWAVSVDPKGRNGTAEFCEFSWDGKLILAGNSQGKAGVFNAADGSKVKEFTYITNFSGGKGGEVECGAFTPDGKLIALGGNNQPVKVFEYATGKVVKEFSSTETDGIAFSPDGKYLGVAAGSKQVWLVRVADWEVLAKIDMGCGVNTVDFNTSGTEFIAGSCAKKVVIVSVPEGKVLKTISNPGSVKSARISPDRKWIATGNAEANSAGVWEYDSGKSVIRLTHKSTVLTATSGDDPNNAKYPHYVEAVAWTKDSKHLFTAGPLDGQLNVYETSGWKQVFSIKASDGAHSIEYLDVSPGGTTLASAGEDGKIHLWRIKGATTALAPLESAKPEGLRQATPPMWMGMTKIGIHDALGRFLY